MSQKKLSIIDNNLLSYFKNNNLFYKLNVYKISAKEDQVVHSWDVGEISVSETSFGKYLEYVP